ncbi:hypothetical protein RUND412_001043 [Rhizina undulata]
MHSSSILQGILLSAAFASAFVPHSRPTTSASEFTPISPGGSQGKRDVEEFHSLTLKRATYPDDGLHPEIRNVQAANRATKKYRRRGIPGPDIDGALAIRNVHGSLQRRGLLRSRQMATYDIATGSSNSQSQTQEGVVPAQTPATPDSVGIDQDGNDFSYFSPVQFGSKEKSFLVVVDTGSSDLWIPSSTCKSTSCTLHTTYGPSDSSSLEVTTNAFQIEYGSGAVAGVIGNDLVSVAGFQVNASFGLATSVSDDFADLPVDGIMGMGSAPDQADIPLMMQNLFDAGLIKQRLFGVALSRNSNGFNDGVLNIGGVDTALFNGTLSFSSSSSTEGLWEVALGNAGVDGQNLNLSGRSAVIDTGTSLLLIPPADALSLHALIPGAETNGETFAIPCNTTANVEFTFNDVAYAVPPVDYVGSAIDSAGELCSSLITGREILGADVWLLGDVFLKNVYSVFDLDSNRVGFAPRVFVDEAASSTKNGPSRTLEAVPSGTAGDITSNDLAISSTTAHSTENAVKVNKSSAGRTMQEPLRNAAWIAPLLLIIGAIVYS